MLALCFCSRVVTSSNYTPVVKQPGETHSGPPDFSVVRFHDTALAEVVHCIGLLLSELEGFVFFQPQSHADQEQYQSLNQRCYLLSVSIVRHIFAERLSTSI